MDKQEIQKEIDKANLDIYATNQRISKLREELAPKLGHGDFGFCWDNTFVVIEQGTLKGSPKAFFADTSGQQKADENMLDAIIFGNIFDLMKNDKFIEMIATLKRKQS